MLSLRSPVFRENLRLKRLRNGGLILLCLLLFLIGSLQLPLKIPLPNSLYTVLENAGIALDPSRVSTGFFPYPHLKLSNVHLNITNDVTFDFDVIRIFPDWKSILILQSTSIDSIEVHRFDLHVLASPAGRPHSGRGSRKSRLTREQEVARYTVFVANAIAKNIKLAWSVKVNQFNLYVDEFNPEKVFTYARNVLYEPMAEGYSRIQLNAGIQSWLQSRIRIFLTPGSPNDEFKYSAADILVHSKISTEKLMSDLQPEGIYLQGELEQWTHLRADIPIYKTRLHSYTELTEPNISLTAPPPSDTESGFLRRLYPAVEKKVWHLLLDGWADTNQVALDQFLLYRNEHKFQSRVHWSFLTGKMQSHFLSNNPYVAYEHIQRFIPAIQIPRNLLVKPTLIEWETREGGISYQSDMVWNFWSNRTDAGTARLWLKGQIQGDLDSAKVNYPMIYGRGTRIRTLSIFFRVQPFPRLLVRLKGKVGAADLLHGGKGPILVQGQLNCAILRKWNCAPRSFTASGNKITVPGGYFARFYRLLNINLFRTWKSLKRESLVQISSLNLSGTISGNRILIHESKVYTDTGNFRLSGELGIPELEGELVLRITPLGVDSILEPIPILGVVVNSTIDYASQLIFRLAVTPNSLRVKSFTVGKGLDSIRNIFR